MSCNHVRSDGSPCRGHIPRHAPEPLCWFHGHDLARDANGRFSMWTTPLRTVFKGGTWRLEMMVKGFEVDKDWAEVLRCSPEVRDAVAKESP